MSSEFGLIERVERGESSLAELIRINYRMEETIGKRRRTMWIVLGVLAEIELALVAYVALRMLELEECIAACHDDTQAKLYEFVMQNRILFGFDGTQDARGRGRGPRPSSYRWPPDIEWGYNRYVRALGAAVSAGDS